MKSGIEQTNPPHPARTKKEHLIALLCCVLVLAGCHACASMNGGAMAVLFALPCGCLE